MSEVKAAFWYDDKPKNPENGVIIYNKMRRKRLRSQNFSRKDETKQKYATRNLIFKFPLKMKPENILKICNNVELGISEDQIKLLTKRK